MRDGEKTERRGRQNKITKGTYNEEGTQSQSTKGGKKRLSQELVLLQTLPWEEKMKERNERGWGKWGGSSVLNKDLIFL